jgi:hypothetical protein
MSEDAKYVLFRPSDYRSELHLVHLEIGGFIHQRKLVIADILADFVAKGGVDRFERVEKESFDFFYQNFLQKLERMEDILMIP